MPRFLRAPRSHRLKLTDDAIEIRFGFFAPAWIEWTKKRGGRMGAGRVWTLRRTRGNARALLEFVEGGAFRVSPADRATLRAAADGRLSS